ncbi:MAG TPA: hypothetical protein VHG28_15190 [Longimicrobiaceae bacterium]|nr:hypothetical protein [Longimicrobiaceae bacterium]
MTRIPSLDAHHLQFAGCRQEEPADCAFLAERGHPRAHGYRVARAFFDSLAWRASQVARFVAYRDQENHVQMSPPSLSLSWEPRGFGGFHSVHPGQEPAWRDYLEAAARAGFPEEVRPNGHLGRWTLHVADRGYQAAIREALRARGIEWRPIDDCVVRRCFDLDHFERVRSAVAEALGDWSLPEYSPPPEPASRASDWIVPVAPAAPAAPPVLTVPTSPRRPARGDQTDLLALLG